MPMTDDEIRGELEKVKADLLEAAEHASAAGVGRAGMNPIHSAVARIDKLLRHFDPGIQLKP